MLMDLSALLAVGRVLLGGIFVVGGLRHFFILPQVTQVMTARGVPSARLVLIVGSTFQVVLGGLLILGVLVQPAALGLVVFTVAASVMLLNFWDMSGPEREATKHGFENNFGIVGGLLIAAAQAG